MNSLITKSIKGTQSYLIVAAVFSGAINILMLAGSMFMLQVYDRVIPSHSFETLLALVLLVVFLYAITSLLETARSRLFARIGRKLDYSLRDAIYEINVKSSLPGSSQNAATSFRDLEQIRSFLAGGGPSVFFDLPWMPFYTILLFMLHPYIGILGIIGIISLAIITIIADKVTSPVQKFSSQQQQEANASADLIRLGAETIYPLGMTGNLKKVWLNKNQASGEAIIYSADKLTFFNGITRFIRMSLQSLMLALGAYLVIKGNATGGIMIASSIILGKALAPVELAISHWRGFINAREAYKRLKELLPENAVEQKKTVLPLPSKSFKINNLVIKTADGQSELLNGINFTAFSGDAIGVIGPSGAGKSTLARSIAGVWPISEGDIRFDDATLDQWTDDDIGKFMGYLPQAVELFSGTLAQNISRFDSNATNEKILDAANLAKIDSFARNLNGGYDADIGHRGSRLSAGQRQMVALARALYGNPFILVLDEPNSALDGEGEGALLNAVTEVRKRGGIVILIAHRPNMMQVCNKVLVLGGGKQVAFGPRDEVLKNFVSPNVNKNLGAMQ